MKTRSWLLLIAALLILSVAAAAWLYLSRSSGSRAQLLRDGVCIREIDLSQVEEAYTIGIDDPEGGSNTIAVEQGRICISDADCPDQTCVKHGWITTSGDPIVCLPHHLTVRIVADEQTTDFDTLSQ